MCSPYRVYTHVLQTQIISVEQFSPYRQLLKMNKVQL